MKKGIAISQQKYILDFLKETGMSGWLSDGLIKANAKLGDI